MGTEEKGPGFLPAAKIERGSLASQKNRTIAEPPNRDLAQTSPGQAASWLEGELLPPEDRRVGGVAVVSVDDSAVSGSKIWRGGESTSHVIVEDLDRRCLPSPRAVVLVPRPDAQRLYSQYPRADVEEFFFASIDVYIVAVFSRRDICATLSWGFSSRKGHEGRCRHGNVSQRSERSVGNFVPHSGARVRLKNTSLTRAANPCAKRSIARFCFSPLVNATYTHNIGVVLLL